MSADSPPPEWYEQPDDELVDDEPAPDAAEMLVVANGVVWWRAA